MVHLNRKTAS